MNTYKIYKNKNKKFTMLSAIILAVIFLVTVFLVMYTEQDCFVNADDGYGTELSYENSILQGYSIMPIDSESAEYVQKSNISNDVGYYNVYYGNTLISDVDLRDSQQDERNTSGYTPETANNTTNDLVSLSSVWQCIGGDYAYIDKLD